MDFLPDPDLNINKLNEVQSTLHHAVQFIAASGKYLKKTKEDDSHTNMEWRMDTQQFVGGLINQRARVALHVPSLTLKVLGPGYLELAALPLSGKTKQEVLMWLRKALMLKQIDASDMDLEMHYEIPGHPTDSGKRFEAEQEYCKELADHRSFSEAALRPFCSEYEQAGPLRTWPHHFDHGSYIPFEFDEEGDPLRSFRIGYAIADSIIGEPYFYVTRWQKNGNPDYKDAPGLANGAWYPAELSGAALSWSELLNSNDPRSIVHNFLSICIDWSVD